MLSFGRRRVLYLILSQQGEIFSKYNFRTQGPYEYLSVTLKKIATRAISQHDLHFYLTLNIFLNSYCLHISNAKLNRALIIFGKLVHSHRISSKAISEKNIFFRQLILRNMQR